jgi:hypothetical protein
VIGDRGDKRQKRFIIHMLFGPATEWDRLPEEVVDVLIHNGVAEAGWQRMQQLDRMQQTRFGEKRGRNFFQALKAIGVVGTAAATIAKAFVGTGEKKQGVLGKIRHRVDVAEPDPRPKAKQRVKDRGESFLIYHGKDYVGSDRTIRSARLGRVEKSTQIRPKSG